MSLYNHTYLQYTLHIYLYSSSFWHLYAAYLLVGNRRAYELSSFLSFFWYWIDNTLLCFSATYIYSFTYLLKWKTKLKKKMKMPSIMWFIYVNFEVLDQILCGEFLYEKNLSWFLFLFFNLQNKNAFNFSDHVFSCECRLIVGFACIVCGVQNIVEIVESAWFGNVFLIDSNFYFTFKTHYTHMAILSPNLFFTLGSHSKLASPWWKNNNSMYSLSNLRPQEAFLFPKRFDLTYLKHTSSLNVTAALCYLIQSNEKNRSLA